MSLKFFHKFSFDEIKNLENNKSLKKIKNYKNIKSFKKIICLILIINNLVFLYGCQNNRQSEIDDFSKKYDVLEEEQLIVYTSHKKEVYLPIITEFENRTGIMVEIHAGGTAEMMQAAINASENGQCDIMFGGGIESYEASKDSFLPYRTNESMSLDSVYTSSEGQWTAFTELPIVFIYNKKLVTSTSSPKKWSDLFDKKWQGKLAFADLYNSGTSYTIISTMEQVLGESYKTLIPRLYEQVGDNMLLSSGDIIPKVSDGSCLIGITLEETALKYIDQGYDIEMNYPADGTTAVPDGIAMLKNAPHSYNVGKFIDFVVSYDTQKYAMDTFYRRPVRTDLELNPDFEEAKMINFDVEKSASEEAEAFALWSEIKASSSDKKKED